MSTIETDSERLELAYAYISSVADLQRAVRVLRNNLAKLSEPQQKLVSAAAIGVINKQIASYLELIHHYLTPLKESDATK